MAKKNNNKGLITFAWVGVNARGKRMEGELNGPSIAMVKAQLRKQGIVPSKVKKKTQPLFGFNSAQKITAKDIAVLTRQIATMLIAGVSLIQALDMIAAGSENKTLQQLIVKIADEVKAGDPLSKALRANPKYFDELYCDLVESGEQSGALDHIFDRVALYKEKAEALNQKSRKQCFTL